MLRRSLAILFASALVLAACGGEDRDPVDTAAPTETTEAPETTETPETEAPTTEDPAPTTDPDDDRPGGLDPATVEDSVGDAFAVLGGGGGGVDFDPEDLECLVRGVIDDPQLADFITEVEIDPDYLPDGVTFRALFGLIDDCGLTEAVAMDMAADDPSLSLADATCLVEGMTDLSPATWDAIMVMDADPNAVPDFAALGEFLDLFDACNLNLMDF